MCRFAGALQNPQGRRARDSAHVSEENATRAHNARQDSAGGAAHPAPHIPAPWPHASRPRASAARLARLCRRRRLVDVRGAACPPCPEALPASDAPEDSTAMMPSLARTTSAVCSLPGAHAHTRSVVCLCWRRGVMLTCTRAGVCWASSTRGMRAARTSQRRSQAGLARRRVCGGVHARRGSCALRLLQCGRARLARRQVRTRFAHTRATVRLHYSAVCTHAGAAVRGFSSTTVLPT